MHIAGAILFAFCVGVVVSTRVKRLGQYAPTYELRMPSALPDVNDGMAGDDSRYSPFGADDTDDEDENAEEAMQHRARRQNTNGDGHNNVVMGTVSNSNVA
jgi:hypothetical protein